MKILKIFMNKHCKRFKFIWDLASKINNINLFIIQTNNIEGDNIKLICPDSL